MIQSRRGLNSTLSSAYLHERAARGRHNGVYFVHVGY